MTEVMLTQTSSQLADVNIQSSVDESSFEVKIEVDRNDIGIKNEKSVVNRRARCAVYQCIRKGSYRLLYLYEYSTCVEPCVAQHSLNPRKASKRPVNSRNISR